MEIVKKLGKIARYLSYVLKCKVPQKGPLTEFEVEVMGLLEELVQVFTAALINLKARKFAQELASEKRSTLTLLAARPQDGTAPQDVVEQLRQAMREEPTDIEAADEIEFDPDAPAVPADIPDWLRETAEMQGVNLDKLLDEATTEAKL